MAIKLSAPVKQEFTLEKSDAFFKNEGDPTKITIQQATQGDNELRNELFSKFQRQYDPDGGVRVTQDISFDAIRRREVYLTLCACNITTEDGKPLFKFNANGRLTDELSFRRAWSQLEPIIADEIHEKVLEMNPSWQSGGGSIIIDRLEKIRAEIREYYGQLNEIRAGLRVKNPIIKPEYLREWELCRQWHVMKWGGGLADQPYLWLLEMEAIGQEVALMESLVAAAKPKEVMNANTNQFNQ